MQLNNRDIVNIERYLEEWVRSYIISDLNNFGIHVVGFDTNKTHIRVTLYYDDLIKGRDIIQPRIKEIIKEVFDLDRIELERCYEATSKNEENMYEILYKISDKKLSSLYILSKL